jgi:hypothetical protein
VLRTLAQVLQCRWSVRRNLLAFLLDEKKHTASLRAFRHSTGPRSSLAIANQGTTKKAQTIAVHQNRPCFPEQEFNSFS